MTPSLFPSDSIIPDIQRRITEETERKKRLEAELQHAEKAIMVWSDALAREEERIGLRPPSVGNNGNEPPEADKGAIFVQFAMRRAAAGFSIRDIITLYREHRIMIGKNYPYFLVDTKYRTVLRREGKTSRGKRYYWIGTASG